MSEATTHAVTIRWAEADDEPRLAEIDQATWSPLVTPAPKASETVFFRPGVVPSDTLVATVDESIVGFALIGTPTPLPASAKVQMLRGLAVAPGYQGRGIGRALVEASIAEAAKRGAVKVTLRVLSTNESARRLYAQAGFETEGVLVDEFILDGSAVDDHLLALRLDT